MNIQGKVFVVTGAGGGIGSKLVLDLLQKGATVAAVDRDKKGLDALKQAAIDKSRLSTHIIDLTDKVAIAALPKAVTSAHTVVDGVINCAGIIQPFVTVSELDEKTIDRVMQVNFYGVLRMTRAFLPYLLQRPEASLVNVSSMGGFLPVPGQSVYGASKAAVKLLSEGLYAELLDSPVKVMTVFPGATDTNIAKNSHVTIATNSADTAKLQASMLSADKAAALIIRGIEKNKPQLFTGSDSRFMNLLYRLSPVRATRFIAQQMKSLLG